MTIGPLESLKCKGIDKTFFFCFFFNLEVCLDYAIFIFFFFFLLFFHGATAKCGHFMGRKNA